MPGQGARDTQGTDSRLEEAVRLLKEKYPVEHENIPPSPTKVVTEPEAFAVYGGG